jgi:taurine dioxygenase
MSDLIPCTPLAPFGAELKLDLGKPLNKAQAGELLRLYRQYKVLLVRNQQLDEAQQKRVMSYLGPVPSDACGLTSNDPNVGLQGDIKLAFHSDLAFAPEPDIGASLFAVDLVADASSTSFTNGILVYRKLPQSLKDRIDDLEAVSVWPLDQTRRNRAAALNPEDPRATHPVVWIHPATGEPNLYLTEMQTDCIVGLPEAESEALIAELFGYLLAPENILTHKWRNGDLVIWDNLATQHARQDVSQVGIRTLRRVSLARRSFFEQFPQFRPKDLKGYSDERHLKIAGAAGK